MAGSLTKYLSSRPAKKAYLVLAVIFVLFFAFNNVLMPWYVNQGGILKVPAVVGLKFEDAVRVLDSLGLEGKKGDTRMDREHPAGTVIAQNPIPDEEVKRGRRVYLTVSGGEVMVTVPSIRGRTLRDARFALEREGLKLGAIEYAPSDQYPANTVMEQRPSPGTTVKRNMYVSVVLSQGAIAEKVAVPDVTSKTLKEAESILAAIGLRLGNITYVPSTDLLPNTIIDQYPRIGEYLTTGSAVDLIVVQGGEKRKELLEY